MLSENIEQLKYIVSLKKAVANAADSDINKFIIVKPAAPIRSGYDLVERVNGLYLETIRRY